MANQRSKGNVGFGEGREDFVAEAEDGSDDDYELVRLVVVERDGLRRVPTISGLVTSGCAAAREK